MEDRILDFVKKISLNLSKTFKFDIWESDDIEQEVYLLMIEAQKEFDPNRGDEYTFYFNYIKSRLMNFKRDNYSTNRYKMGILDAKSLDLDVIENIDQFIGQYKEIINSRIDSSFRADYLRYCEGVKIPHKRKNLILNHMREIIQRSIKNEEIMSEDFV